MRMVRGQGSEVRGHFENLLPENRSSRMVWGRANTGFAPTGNAVWDDVFWVLENGVWDGVLWLMARLGIVGNERLEARERGMAGRIQDSPLRKTPSGTVFFDISKIARGTVFSSVRLIAHRSSLIAALGVRA
jgi:hypothetical protein